MRLLIAPMLAAAALLVTTFNAALAQDSYPNRPVKILIAFPVGGLLDTVSRIVEDRDAG